MRTIRFSIGLGLLLCAAQALAQFNPISLENLIESGRADEAYRQALAYRDASEGDPLFDFYYGWAATDSGHADEGVAALSRVILQQPQNARARLELARAFYVLGEDTRARQEFEIVLAQDPPAAVRATVQRFLDAIAQREAMYRPSASAYAQLSAGYDTNINSAPADDPYEFLFGQEMPWASEQGSGFGQLEAGGQYASPFSRRSAWFVRADGSWRSHTDGSRFDNGYVTGQGGFTHQVESNQFRMALIGQHYLVEDEIFRTLFGMNGEWNHRARPDLLYGANLTYARLHYPDQEHRDATLLSGGLNMLRGTRSGTWFANGFVGSERADDQTDWTDASVSRLFGGARAGFQWALGADSAATVSGLMQLSRYEGEWPWPEERFERVRREDTYAALELELKHGLGGGLSLVGNLGFADNQSSVASYDYQRHQARIGLRYER